MSDAEVAVVMGVTEGAVRKIRRGDTKSFDLDRALKLCERLGVDPWYLAYGRSRKESGSASKAAGQVAGISLLADLPPAAGASGRLARIEARVDLLTRLIQMMAGARAGTLDQSAAKARRKRKRST